MINTTLVRRMVRTLANDKRKGRSYLEYQLLAALREIVILRAQMSEQPDPTIPGWVHRICACIGVRITHN